VDDTTLTHQQALVYSKELSALYKTERRKTRELETAHEKLQAYAAKLEESHKELSRFLFIASHDLQEPLRKIHLFSDRLEQTCGVCPQQSPSAQYLDRLKNASAHIQELITSLVEYSAINEHPLCIAPVFLETVLMETLREFSDLARATGARVHWDTLPVIAGDRALLKRLLFNLLDNAFKFRRDGESPKIKITVRPLDMESWNISVTDNGRGFDNRHGEKMFEPFMKLHQDRPGPGMGLAICRKIVRLHRGAITGRGEPDNGAVFDVVLPQNPLPAETFA
jgi:light-regulated signal transduction histidine kinase (bacteriophytochrome)